MFQEIPGQPEFLRVTVVFPGQGSGEPDQGNVGAVIPGVGVIPAAFVIASAGGQQAFMAVGYKWFDQAVHCLRS